MRLITDVERRSRLAVRHGLAAQFADPLTTPAHLDVDGLNIMAAGGGGAGLEEGLGAAAEEPFFTALNLAYLRERLWVLPTP